MEKDERPRGEECVRYGLAGRCGKWKTWFDIVDEWGTESKDDKGPYAEGCAKIIGREEMGEEKREDDTRSKAVRQRGLEGGGLTFLHRPT